MATGRKNVIARLVDVITKEQEERRCLEELTNSVREDVEDLVAQATQRVYQLRGRTVVITTPEGCRRKKSARTEDTVCKRLPARQAAAVEEQPQDGNAAGPSVPVPGRALEQPQQEQTAGVLAPVADTVVGGGAVPSTAHAVRKRGRPAATSQAKTKRAKALAEQVAPAADPQETAAAAGAGATSTSNAAQVPQPVPMTSVSAAGPGAAGKPQSTMGYTATAGEPAGTDAGAAAASTQRSLKTDAVVSQTQDSALEDGPRRTRGRTQKQPVKRPEVDAHAEAEAGPSGTAGAAPTAPAAARGSPRATRARRGQPIPAAVAPPSPVAARQTRARARLKRDVKEAQLGSPCMHPKTKTGTGGTTMNSAAAPAKTTSAAATAAGGEEEQSEELLRPAATTEQPGAASSMPLQVAGPLKSAQATEQPGAELKMTKQGGGTQHPAAAAELPDGQCSAELSASEPDNGLRQTVAAMTEQPGTGPSGRQQDGAQQLQQRSASPATGCSALPPQSQPEKQPAAPVANVRRMPPAIAATVALFDSKAAAAVAGPGACSKADRAAGQTAGARGAARGIPANHNPASELAAQPDAIEPDSAADKHFSFGTKPKEQSSPAMPHFGPPAAVVAAEDDTAQLPLDMAEADGVPDEQQTGNATSVEAADDAAAPEVEPSSSVEPGSFAETPAADGSDGSEDAEETPAADGYEDAEETPAARRYEDPEEPLEEASAADGSGDAKEPLGEALAAEDGKNVEAPDATDVQSPGSGIQADGAGEHAGTRAEARNRSLSLSLALRSPSFAAPGAPTVFAEGPADEEGPAQGTPEPRGSGAAEMADSGASQLRSAQEPALSTAAGFAEAAAEDVGGDLDGTGQADPEPSLGDVAQQREEASPEDAATAAEARGKWGATTEACSIGATDEECGDYTDVVAGAGESVPPVASANEDAAAGPPVEAQGRADGGDTDAVGQVQPNKPKGGNLVSAVRSFLPQRVAPSPAPAAGKKVVKVKALEAAQAAKQKEAVRAAERALARAAAADRQRQGQGDAGPSNANSRPGTSAPGAPRLTPTKAAPGTHAPTSARLTPTKAAPVPGSTRLTPTKATVQHGADPGTACTTTLDVDQPTYQGTTTTTAADEHRKDCPAGNAAAAAMSVKAKAAFFQLKEEQAKRAAADHGAGRKAAGGAAAVPAAAGQNGMPSYKAGAQARVALAAGDNEGALAASAAPAPAVPSSSMVGAAAPSASRGANPAPAAAAAETVADKHKRVEAKRREEEERRRAELEARSKAKDDKLRNFEAAKQQQRLGGGAAAAVLRPPPPPPANPLAVQPTGKRPAINAAGAGAGQAAVGQMKQEPENNRVGPVGPALAKTPAPKLATARTPGPKAGPVAGNMVSPAVQLQVKLLPAVHAQGPGGGAPGLPKPRPPGAATQAKQAQPAVAAHPTVKEEGVTPGAADLTEEERRHVHAIQTSPYVAQVKPRTPAMPTSSKKVFNYEISPYRSDSDVSDDDEDEPGRLRKPVPAWAAHDKVLAAVRAQAGIDSDSIFGTYPSTIDIVKVFSDMPPPGPTDARGRPRRDYRRRGSSGNWDADS